MENSNVINSFTFDASQGGTFQTQSGSSTRACVAALLIAAPFAPGMLTGASFSSRNSPSHPQNFSGQRTTVGQSQLVTAASPAEQIEMIRSDFHLSMTKLAEVVLGVSRPTVYTWRKENSAPPVVRKKLQALAAAAAHWKQEGGDSSRSYLLDYQGLDGEGTTLLEKMSEHDVSAGELMKLIDIRFQEAEKGEAYAREALGDQKIKSPQVSEEESQRNDAWNSLNQRFSWNR